MVTDLAVRLNGQLNKVVADPGARSWVKLFNKVDEDGSGKISYAEFERMVRSELKLPKGELGKEQLLALLDEVCRMPSCTDAMYLERVYLQHKDHCRLIKPCSSAAVVVWAQRVILGLP